jgi:hypothetical protein
MRMKQPVRAKKPAHKKGSPRFTRALGTPAMIALVFCVMGAAILLAVSRPSPDVVASAAPSHQSAAAYGHENKPAVPAASAATPRAAYVAPRSDPDAEPAAPANSARKAAPVTITGCLEQDDETFRLKNAMGQDAPKARSWKSGFLKKGPAPIDVIDASHRLKLPTHVGQRVSVTGVLSGREMQVRSLERVAASCNQKS